MYPCSSLLFSCLPFPSHSPIMYHRQMYIYVRTHVCSNENVNMRVRRERERKILFFSTFCPAHLSDFTETTQLPPQSSTNGAPNQQTIPRPSIPMAVSFFVCVYSFLFDSSLLFFGMQHHVQPPFRMNIKESMYLHDLKLRYQREIAKRRAMLMSCVHYLFSLSLSPCVCVCFISELHGR